MTHIHTSPAMSSMRVWAHSAPDSLLLHPVHSSLLLRFLPNSRLLPVVGRRCGKRAGAGARTPSAYDL